MLGLIQDSPWFRNWIATFRHTNTWVFITAQRLTNGAPTVLRECTSLALMFYTRTDNEVKTLWDYWGADYGKVSAFKALFNATTSIKHTCLAFDTELGRYMSFKAAGWPAPFKLARPRVRR